MEIVLVRMDNRLLHGVVCTQYLPKTRPQRIMVIDDEVALNPTKKQMMMLAKPAGVAASIITLEKALENFKANKYEGQRIFMLVKRPRIVKELVKAGVKIENFCVGATQEIQGIKLSRRCFITEEDVLDIKEIRDKVPNIYVQHSEADVEVDIWKILDEKR